MNFADAALLFHFEGLKVCTFSSTVHLISQWTQWIEKSFQEFFKLMTKPQFLKVRNFSKRTLYTLAKKGIYIVWKFKGDLYARFSNTVMREGLFQHVLFCGLRCGWAAFAVFAILMSFLCLLFPRFLKTTLKILHKRQQTFCWPTNKIHAINKAAFFPLTLCTM